MKLIRFSEDDEYCPVERILMRVSKFKANEWYHLMLPEGAAHVRFDQIDLDVIDKDELERMRKVASPMVIYKAPSMETRVNEDGVITLSKLYVGITLETDDKETMSICMRDSGFEFTYEGEKYYAKNGKLGLRKDEK